MTLKLKIKIPASGDQVIGLYNDKLDYSKLGDTEITRATDVCWDADDQKWKVVLLSPKGKPVGELPGRFSSRKAAVRFEIEYLQEFMEVMCPYLKNMRKDHGTD